MSTTTSYQNGTLTVRRLIKAPRPAVFDAWIQTSKVQLWWGCGYAEAVKSEIEPKLGGKYHHLMTLTGAGDYEHFGLITAYEPPILLEYKLQDAMVGHTMTVRVDFAEQDAHTLVCLTQTNVLDEHSPFVMKGWTSAFAALAYFLETGKVRDRTMAHPTTSTTSIS